MNKSLANQYEIGLTEEIMRYNFGYPLYIACFGKLNVQNYSILNGEGIFKLGTGGSI